MKRISIKVGSSFFIDKRGNVDEGQIDRLVAEIAKIKNLGFDVCLVTSGAIAVGVKYMNLDKKPSSTNKKQALAAIGQMSLMQLYEQAFLKRNLKCAQILLSHDDFGNRTRVNNLKATFDALFEFGVTPIVNENDAVATTEIKVGDNDTLSAMTSLVIGSSLLILASDVDGLFTANPATNPSAKLIERVEQINDDIFRLASPSSTSVGTGGMITKIKAGQIATSNGIPMVITSHFNLDNLSKIAMGESVGTYFLASTSPMPLKKCWIKFCANVSGKIFLDNGAIDALIHRNSVLSCGISKVLGDFTASSVVEICNTEGVVVALGISAFSSSAIKSFIKKENSQLIVHANNIVLLD